MLFRSVSQSRYEQERNTSPVTTFVYVESSDIDNINYKSGSEGQVKTLTEYKDLAKTIVVTVTTFKYQNATYPTKVTEIVVV